MVDPLVKYYTIWLRDSEESAKWLRSGEEYEAWHRERGLTPLPKEERELRAENYDRRAAGYRDKIARN